MPPEPPTALRRLYEDGRLIPFVGAGASMAVQWEVAGEPRRGPSWREFVDEAARKMGFSDPELLRVRGNDLQILEYFELTQGIQELKNWLLMEMAAPDEAIRNSPIHQALASLQRCRVYYTTNYDDFLERSLELGGRRTIPIAAEAHFARAAKEGVGAPDLVEVIKFHGDFNTPDQMVLSESDYEERLNLRTAMDQRMRSDLLGKAVLFIGYSFRDPNVSYLFSLVNELFAALPDSEYGRRAFIAIADPSEFEHRLFQRRNMDVIPISSKRIGADVAELLARLDDSR